MKKAIIVVAVVGAVGATAIIKKNHCGSVPVQKLPQSFSKHLKNSDVLSPKTVKLVGKKVDKLIEGASNKASNPLLSDLLRNASKLNSKQQKKLIKYVRKNFS